MWIKLITGVLASALAVTFLSIPIYKLQDPALITVVAIGVLLMVIDLIEKVRQKDE